MFREKSWKCRSQPKLAGAHQKGSYIRVMAVACILSLIAACGTIIHGTREKIGIASIPSGASVVINNKPYGQTPVLVNLKRRHNQHVKIELPGYIPYETIIRRHVRASAAQEYGSFWLIGLPGCFQDAMALGLCILFFPVWLTSLTTDAISGGLYDLNPEQIVAPLIEEEIGLHNNDRGSDGDVTHLHSDSSWQKDHP